MSRHVIGSYQNKNSFLEKADARLKIFFILLSMVLILLPFNFEAYLFLLLFSFVLTFIAKIPINYIYKLLKPFRFLLLFLLIINIAFVRHGEVLFQIGEILVFKESINATLFVFIRVLVILMLANVLTFTTKPTNLTYALEFYLKPLKYLKIKVGDIVLMMTIALRFLPTLFLESKKIIQAQQSRGVDFESKKTRTKIKAITSMLVPLFVMSMQRADDLSNSMISRGYDIEIKKTRYKRFKLSLVDLFLVLIYIFIVFIFLYLRTIEIW